MSANLVDVVANYLGYDRGTVIALARRAPVTYKLYYIPKKAGGQRAIHHPSKETKSLQYALINAFLAGLPVHEAALAYRKGRHCPTLYNARIHSRFPYTVRLDFKDFFHSIAPSDLLTTAGLHRSLSAEEEGFLSNALFIRLKGGRSGLAIGAPSSPCVSNAVLYEIDTALASFAASVHGVYTRYADDIAFSTHEKGNCPRFIGHVRNILSQCASPRVQLNEEKTRLGSRGRRRVITGIVLRPDGGTSLGRRSKRFIRKLVFEYSRGALSPRWASYLSGYLAFVLGTEPSFYSSLAMKFGADVVQCALRHGERPD